MNAAEITDKLGLHSLRQRAWVSWSNRFDLESPANALPVHPVHLRHLWRRSVRRSGVARHYPPQGGSPVERLMKEEGSLLKIKPTSSSQLLVTHSRISLPLHPQNFEVAVVLRRLIGQHNRVVHKTQCRNLFCLMMPLSPFPFFYVSKYPQDSGVPACSCRGYHSGQARENGRMRKARQGLAS